jgi:hypothetical protein
VLEDIKRWKTTYPKTLDIVKYKGLAIFSCSKEKLLAVL